MHVDRKLRELPLDRDVFYDLEQKYAINFILINYVSASKDLHDHGSIMKTVDGGSDFEAISDCGLLWS